MIIKIRKLNKNELNVLPHIEQVWAFMLGMLEGPSRKSTTFYQRMIPKQPLPDLDDTLDR